MTHRLNCSRRWPRLGEWFQRREVSLREQLPEQLPELVHLVTTAPLRRRALVCFSRRVARRSRRAERGRRPCTRAAIRDAGRSTDRASDTDSGERSVTCTSPSHMHSERRSYPGGPGQGPEPPPHSASCNCDKACPIHPANPAGLARPFRFGADGPPVCQMDRSSGVAALGRTFCVQIAMAQRRCESGM